MTTSLKPGATGRYLPTNAISSLSTDGMDPWTALCSNLESQLMIASSQMKTSKHPINRKLHPALTQLERFWGNVIPSQLNARELSSQDEANKTYAELYEEVKYIETQLVELNGGRNPIPEKLIGLASCVSSDETGIYISVDNEYMTLAERRGKLTIDPNGSRREFSFPLDINLVVIIPWHKHCISFVPPNTKPSVFPLGPDINSERWYSLTADVHTNVTPDSHELLSSSLKCVHSEISDKSVEEAAL